MLKPHIMETAITILLLQRTFHLTSEAQLLVMELYLPLMSKNIAADLKGSPLP